MMTKRPSNYAAVILKSITILVAGVAGYLHRFGSIGDLPLPESEHCNHPPEKQEHISRILNRRRFSFLPTSGMIPPAKLDMGRFVSPEREAYEDDMTYERRWAEARDKYDKMLHQDEKKPLVTSSSDNILSAQSDVNEENTNEETLTDEQEQEIQLEMV
ncbi:Hypothetical protein NTJ_08426 [Nesidiocoris tenuis]|uniref:Uncharacterized protein n=1 Tax=Nesidiocoris tenuis TaxID=355587 RepID=A0ABN7ATU7_9HEMI|nr:Hypothetical protein NTJ_08426 [Nesidiocoris tenuis]